MSAPASSSSKALEHPLISRSVGEGGARFSFWDRKKSAGTPLALFTREVSRQRSEPCVLSQRALRGISGSASIWRFRHRLQTLSRLYVWLGARAVRLSVPCVSIRLITPQGHFVCSRVSNTGCRAWSAEVTHALKHI